MLLPSKDVTDFHFNGYAFQKTKIQHKRETVCTERIFKFIYKVMLKDDIGHVYL